MVADVALIGFGPDLICAEANGKYKMAFNLTTWPDIDRASVPVAFSEVPISAYPEIEAIGHEGAHEALQGQGGLFLASDMAARLSLKPGMRVLDLGCGAGVTSLFIAERYGVQVFAVDSDLPVDLQERAARAKVADRVIPVTADARALPFPQDYFHAVFCMNSFFYFGTDDLYPSYLLGFVKQAGEIVIGGPCYRDELSSNTPEEFLLEFPDCLAVHSPAWWRNHFEKTRCVTVTHSELHPRGRQFWEDRVRYLLAKQHPKEMSDSRRSMVFHIIRMLNRDSDGFVSHFMVHMKKIRDQAL